jgi:hypothetical protein
MLGRLVVLTSGLLGVGSNPDKNEQGGAIAGPIYMAKLI